jgi:hypothetical protein
MNHRLGIFAFFLALLLGACGSPQATVKVAQNDFLVADNVANDAWLGAATVCKDLPEAQKEQCAVALLPVQAVLVKIGNDVALGQGDICELSAVVPALKAVLAVKGVATPALQTAVDDFAALLVLCSADAGAEGG